jgi:UDP-N-acetylmuramyl pentapeptide phosphotransferase/UDP-N-acetylglucosamine-1-phosphate transferase
MALSDRICRLRLCVVSKRRARCANRGASLAIVVLIVSFAVALGCCGLLIRAFRRAFLAIPDARSSHSSATPQGGGLVVLPVALVIAFAAAPIAAGASPRAFVWSAVAAILALTLVGAWDDRHSLNPIIRLAVQAAAAGLALAPTPRDFGPAIAIFPPTLISALLLIAMLWFINLTNFMDGLDLLSVSQFVPAFATAYWLLAGLGGPAVWLAWLSLATAGALVGFAWFNWPPARLFLGDSGSLPLGLLGSLVIIVVAGAHGLGAALLPFLYYIVDASLTLARRLLAGEKFWRPHRDHFYQQAVRRGLSTLQVIGRVLACNLLLCALAVLAAGRSASVQLVGVAIGLAIVALLMRDLARKRA